MPRDTFAYPDLVNPVSFLAASRMTGGNPYYETCCDTDIYNIASIQVHVEQSTPVRLRRRRGGTTPVLIGDIDDRFRSHRDHQPRPDRRHRKASAVTVYGLVGVAAGDYAAGGNTLSFGGIDPHTATPCAVKVWSKKSPGSTVPGYLTGTSAADGKLAIFVSGRRRTSTPSFRPAPCRRPSSPIRTFASRQFSRKASKEIP